MAINESLFDYALSHYHCYAFPSLPGPVAVFAVWFYSNLHRLDQKHPFCVICSYDEVEHLYLAYSLKLQYSHFFQWLSPFLWSTRASHTRIYISVQTFLWHAIVMCHQFQDTFPNRLLALYMMWTYHEGWSQRFDLYQKQVCFKLWNTNLCACSNRNRHIESCSLKSCQRFKRHKRI